MEEKILTDDEKRQRREDRIKRRENSKDGNSERRCRRFPLFVGRTIGQKERSGDG